MASLLKKIKAFFGFAPAPKKTHYTVEQDPTNGDYDIDEHAYDPIENETTTERVESFSMPDTLQDLYKTTDEIIAMKKNDLILYARTLGLHANTRDKKHEVVERVSAKLRELREDSTEV